MASFGCCGSLICICSGKARNCSGLVETSLEIDSILSSDCEILILLKRVVTLPNYEWTSHRIYLTVSDLEYFLEEAALNLIIRANSVQKDKIIACLDRVKAKLQGID